MKATSHYKNKLLYLLLCSIIAFSLTGCMEAGAADWIGYPTMEETPSEEPSTEEAAPESVGEITGGDKEVANELPTYVLDDDEEEEIEEDEEEEIDEDEEISDNSISDDSISDNTASLDDDEDGENHDVTKGSWDGSDWSAEATIGENYEISVTVEATRNSMQQEKVTSYSPAAKKKGDNIDDIRFAFFKKVEGSKSLAADDVEEYEDVDELSDKKIDSLMAVADDLGKLFAQFGITGYDFEHPAENDDDEVTIDLYRKNSFQYYMYLSYDGNKLTEISFELQEY